MIRKARIEDIPNIMMFIGEHWKKDHILATNRDFFEWMYVDKQGCNVILAVDETNCIYGMIGVVRYNSSDNPDVVGMMWKVVPTVNPRLGIDLVEKKWEIYNTRCDVGPGLNKRALKINQMLGCFGAALGHLYVLGNCSQYNIAKVFDKQKRLAQKSDKQIVELYTRQELKAIYDDTFQRRRIPYKDFEYIVHRFLHHPVFSYRFLGIKNENGSMKAFIIIREVEYNGAKACKIVDYYGPYEEIIDTASEMYRFIDENQYEYIDIYCYGFPEEYLFTAGFSWCKDDEAIIPNYFAPFEQKNIDIFFSASQLGEFDVFRGDGDQDRPS